MSVAHHMRAAQLALSLAGVAALAACGDTSPPPPGALNISFSTRPGDETPFVWGVSIDGASPRNILSSDTGKFVLPGVAAGDHHLIVSSLPKVCTSGTDDRVVTVPSAETLSVSIGVVCARVTGDIGLVVATAGSDFDVDGYTVVLDGVPVTTIVSSGVASLTLPKVTPGPHDINLIGLASNCTQNANQNHTANVVAGQLFAMLLNVTCASLAGTIRVVTTTNTVATSDPDGYLVAVGSTTGVVAPNNGATNVSKSAGTYTVTLSDIEPSCSVAAASQNVTVAQQQTVTVTFDVTCGPYPATVAGVTVADPASDTLPNGTTGTAGATGSYDILSTSTRYGPGFIVLSYKYSRPITNVLLTVIDFDLDENPSTGITPLVNAFGGASTQGVDMYIVFETDAPAVLVTNVNTGTQRSLRTFVAGDSIQLFLPLAKLGPDDGSMTISATVGPPDRATDVAPNTGQITSHVPPGAALGTPFPQTTTRPPAIAGGPGAARGRDPWKKPSPP